jgi:uncharacterized protein involved in exopolysaccharide biosynthesis
MVTTRAREVAEPQGFDLREFLGALSRRRRVAAITAVAGLLATVLLAVLLPAKYRSVATVLIEQQELPADLVRSTVTTYADQRVQIISQRVMTSQTLLDIVRRYDLYPGDRDRLSREELIEKMRDDIGLRMISADVIDPRSGTPREATIAFNVSYTSPSPSQAVKVANELTTLYLNENLASRTRQAEEASAFLTAEGDRISRRISELEAELAKFKGRNAEELPELMQMNMQMLDRNEQELRQIETREMSLQQQKVFLEAQLAQISPTSMMMSETGERIMGPEDRLKVLRARQVSARAALAPGHPDLRSLEREIDALERETGGGTVDPNDIERRITDLRAALLQARESYSEDHPDVRSLERELATLEAERAQVVAPVERRSTAPPDNPAFIQLQAQLVATTNDLAALAQQRAKIRGEIYALNRRITSSPEVEREYRELARDYQNAQAKYQEIRAKQMEAVVAQNLEAGRKGERFTLIEPPLPPTEPVSPNRPLILLIGTLLSLGAGLGMVMLREATDPCVRGERDIIDIVGAPVLALVPNITTEAERRQGRRRASLAVGAAAVSSIALLGAIHFAYRPLDVLWFVVRRKLGF